MSTPQEIVDFKKQMKDRHNLRLGEQRTDQEFFENKYPLKLIKKPEYQMRTNFPARMINAITQQLISDLPKVYVKPKSDTDVAKESCKRLSIAFNKWIAYLIKMAVNPFDETFKNYNIRGECWLYTPHNMMFANYGGDWREDYPDTPPVHFILYDPMVVFSEPTEELDGEPSRVLVAFKRNVQDIKRNYPQWSNPQNTDDNKEADFILYFDKEKSYAEADEEPLFRNRKSKKLLNGTGERDNPYGCVPFVHLFSGWGKTTQGMNPDLLAYSRIRMLRDLITEDSQVRSDQLYNFHTFAHRSLTLYIPAGAEVPNDWAEAFKNEPDKLNQIYLPEGANPDWFKPQESQLFSGDAYAYSDRVRMDLAQEFPTPLQGGTGTSSGREADILRGAGLSIYDCAVNNTAGLWARGLYKTLKVCESVDLLPKGISKEDINRCGEIIVDLRTDDPIARDRQINMGSTLVHEGLKSLHNFLVEDRRMAEEEADTEETRIMADKYIAGNPMFASFISYMAAQKSGMGKELQQFQQMTGESPIGANVMTSAMGSQGGEPRKGNIKTQTGREMVDVGSTSYGQRTPPQY